MTTAYDALGGIAGVIVGAAIVRWWYVPRLARRIDRVTRGVDA